MTDTQLDHDFFEASEDDANVVEMRKVTKKFGDTLVFKDVDLDVSKSEVVVLVGPSGAGKSTLLRCVNGLEQITSGSITVAQRDVLGRNPDEAVEKAKVMLEHVGMSHKIDAYPASLSGGQAQRVAIARALAMDPAMMLFDEPTSALDPELVGEVLSVMRDLANEGMTMMCVTHEMRFARRVADRIILIADKGIAEEGSPEQLLDDPQTDRARDFLASLDEE